MMYGRERGFVIKNVIYQQEKLVLCSLFAVLCCPFEKGLHLEVDTF